MKLSILKIGLLALLGCFSTVNGSSIRCQSNVAFVDWIAYHLWGWHDCGKKGNWCCGKFKSCKAVTVCDMDGSVGDHLHCQECSTIGQLCCGGNLCSTGNICNQVNGTCEEEICDNKQKS